MQTEPMILRTWKYGSFLLGRIHLRPSELRVDYPGQLHETVRREDISAVRRTGIWTAVKLQIQHRGGKLTLKFASPRKADEIKAALGY